MHGRARPFEVGIRARHERDGHDFSHVRAVAIVATINGSVGLKRARDAAVIVHDQIRVTPIPAELEAGVTVIYELRIPWPVVNIQMNRLSIGRKVEMLPHPTSQFHSEILAARSTDVSYTGQICLEIHTTATRRRLNADKDRVIAAFGMQLPPPLPIRQNMEFS